MTDQFSAGKRSAIMRAIRGKDTKPEHAVRSLIHRLGYRYRLHVRELPGCPDLVFPSRRKVIFVHGCFWHRHHCRKGRSTPTTRARFWKEKLESNKSRDVKHRRKLRRLGWSVLTIWECQIAPKKADQLAQRVRRFLDGSH
ncbi:MAG: DNA mismatch endonuclease Vsr [Phycisphaerae bacterium]|nr:DNA mismatch endonuclease Vsr [Phycisphaerae bacterium]